MPLLKYLLGAFLTVAVLSTVVGVGFAAYGLFKVSSVVADVANRPSRSERIAAERAEKLRSKAEKWKAFCTKYDCADIPEGRVVKEIGGDTLSFIHRIQPRREGGCWLTSDSYDQTEYIDGKVVRGAALGHIAQPYWVQCGAKSSPFTRWEDFAIIYGGRLSAAEPGRNNVYLELLGPRHFRETDPKPTYASRRPLLLPATAEFDLFDPELQTGGARIYLSKARMFQGRHVILLCNDRCEMQTISFAEDQGLKTLHVQELIQFSWHDTEWDTADCTVFKPRWECGPPMKELLASMSRYVQFLDQAVDAARRTPLPKLQ
ncbi:MAG: hypothetical protein OXC60_11210 [Litoreibacter sp.]|nr:hypothetical protein [Litoreibacter sp.]